MIDQGADIRELSLDELNAVAGGGDVLDSALLGAGTGALIGSLAGGGPITAAAGAAIGATVAVVLHYW